MAGGKLRGAETSGKNKVLGGAKSRLMMFANYAARHFLGKHKKVICERLRLKLIKKHAGNSIWMWPFVSRTEKRGQKKEQEKRKSKGQLPVKDSVSDVINL